MKTYIELILLKIRLFVLFLVCKWDGLWGNKSGEEMHQNGELIVTGEGEAKVELRSHPVQVKVYFDGNPIVTPCNPHHHDHLHWHVENLHHHHKHDHRHDHCDHKDEFVLVITWRVHNIRVIKWSVHY